MWNKKWWFTGNEINTYKRKWDKHVTESFKLKYSEGYEGISCRILIPYL
jgi:hypothetical protein